jgi:hypothetical protein
MRQIADLTANDRDRRFVDEPPKPLDFDVPLAAAGCTRLWIGSQTQLSAADAAARAACIAQRVLDELGDTGGVRERLARHLRACDALGWYP